MGDLISRGKLFNLLAPVQTLGEAYGIIQGMETVDAVPVVRCRECKWFEDANEDCGTCGFFDGARSANHYCGEGERKDGEAHD